LREFDTNIGSAETNGSREERRRIGVESKNFIFAVASGLWLENQLRSLRGGG
jgi:hypothetical protein